MRNRSGFGWLEFIIGIILILLGVYTLFNPERTITGMVAIYGVLAVIMGIADIVLYVQVERYTGFGPIVSLVSGILSTITGFMLLVYPGAGVLALSILFPIWFIAHCISRLCHSGHIRIVAGNGIYYFTLILNIIGLIVGFLMILRPFFTILTASWLIGFYLILLGIESIVIAVSEIGLRR